MADTGLVTYDKSPNCDCKKEIFATHDRFILIPGVPANAVAYEMTNNLDGQGLDVSNSYFHLIYPTLNGTSSDPIGPQLTEYFANPQDGILWSDVAGVQAVIDFVLPSMNLSVGDVVYTINTSNLPVFFLSPTAVAELVNNTYLHIYWGPNFAHNDYNELADVTVVSANSEILIGGEEKCVGIQEIKEKDTCTGEETYRYVIEDSGALVDVISIYPSFLESDVLHNCPHKAQEADLEDCDGTIVSKSVDSIVGAYVLNQYNKHTEKIYDVLSAVFGGNIAYTYTAPRTVALNYTAVTLANDVLRYYWTDFGDGYNDVGANPSHAYSADGSYEIKSYAITASGNKVLLTAKEVNILASAITYAPTALPQPVTPTEYKVLISSAFQDYCGSAVVGAPYNAIGTSYTLIGDFVTEKPDFIDDLEDNADWKVSTGSATTPTLTTPLYSTNRTLLTVNTTPAAYNVATIVNSREITVQNITNSDVTITTSQGAQIVATRGVITLSNPNNTTVNQAAFTGNINVAFLSSVGGNIGGVAPRVIINQKAHV